MTFNGLFDGFIKMRAKVLDRTEFAHQPERP